VLEKDVEDQLEKWRSVTKRQGGEEYRTYSKRRKGNRIGHFWRGNCLLKHVSEGNDIEKNISEGKARKKT